MGVIPGCDVECTDTIMFSSVHVYAYVWVGVIVPVFSNSYRVNNNYFYVAMHDMYIWALSCMCICDCVLSPSPSSPLIHLRIHCPSPIPSTCVHVIVVCC